MGSGQITAMGLLSLLYAHGCLTLTGNRSFEQYCDLSRQYDPAPDPAILPDGTVVPAYHGPGVDTFLKSFGREDLLEYS